MRFKTINTDYIGRFAPSPTGHLHLGSLYTALASFLHARANQGQWLLRIDDLDTPRNVSGAAEQIINTLHCYGLQWDNAVFYQSQHPQIYPTIIQQLNDKQWVYPCYCTRKLLSSLNATAVYPKICVNTPFKKATPYALRIKSQDGEIVFNDECQGHQSDLLAFQHGDFIVKRKDHIIAYQLAAVIDDERQKISHVIRGFDLLDSTPKQIFLQQVLGYSTPHYAHIPVLVDQQGNKLSKQTHAPAVSIKQPEKTLFLLLQLLQQNPPVQLKTASVNRLINWGIENWNTAPLKKIRAINYQIK